MKRKRRKEKKKKQQEQHNEWQTFSSSFFFFSSNEYFSAQIKVHSKRLYLKFHPGRCLCFTGRHTNLKRQYMTILTCSNPNQSCLSPSCLLDDQVWQLVGGSPSPDHVFAGRCRLLHILRTGVPENDMQTTKNAKLMKKMYWFGRNNFTFGNLNAKPYLPSLVIDLKS